MPLNGATWGKSVADVVKAVGVTAGAPITDAQLEALWTAIKTADTTELTTKADVIPGTFKDSLSAPITGMGKIQ